MKLYLRLSPFWLFHELNVHHHLLHCLMFVTQCLPLQVVGLLIRARKYKLVSFEGETLFQGTNDKTPIYLLRYFILSDADCWGLDILFKFPEVSRRSKKFSKQDKIRQTFSGVQLVINNGGFLDFIVDVG